MSARTALVDASSVIILCKTNMFHILVDIYRVVLAESVYQEVTALPYRGAEECIEFKASKKIDILETTNLLTGNCLPGLDRGESETIQFFEAGYGDFIIVDDGAAARYCQRKGYPFINALLFPVVLKYAQALEEDFCDTMFEEILETGRYSDKVIKYARNCSKEQIAFALP